MKFSKKQGQEADKSILDDLISQCESSMVAPFKKKKAVAVEAIPEECSDEEEGDDEPKESDKPDLSDMDMEDLVELYKEIKARKGE